MTLSIIYLLIGIILLYAGAELLVRACVRLAFLFKLSPLIIGITILSFSTSLPEAFSSVIAQVKGGLGDIALGNVVGSNIANIGLVLGTSLLISPCRRITRLNRRELPFSILINVLLWGFLFGDVFGRWKGAFFIFLLILYLIYAFHTGGSSSPIELPKIPKWKFPLSIFFFLIGLGVLLLGAEGLIRGAVGLGRTFGISERILGVTVVAIGTSLPELATALVAAYHKQEEIVLGNVVGSNIFNPLFILAIASLIRPIQFSQRIFTFDAPVMIAFSVLLWVTLLLCPRLNRLHGLFFLVFYASYLFWTSAI